MKKVGYRFLDHTADVLVESRGRSLEEAFEQTAYSLIETITPNLKLISPITKKIIKIEAEDKEALLFDFLSEFLYIFDVEQLVFNDIKIETIKKDQEKYQIRAIVRGEKFDKNKHEIGCEVKAITYSFMEIEEKKNSVKINIVFDI
ncbi:MAG: archease [Promethearchaeota archaeon]|nr:MAG: archease [Candidatus Lokiarchaeota archaeon]TKJ22477.1 MAG: archease [Candidatus Lokiarchaeota archaeon Loki_b32]